MLPAVQTTSTIQAFRFLKINAHSGGEFLLPLELSEIPTNHLVFYHASSSGLRLIHVDCWFKLSCTTCRDRFFGSHATRAKEYLPFVSGAWA